MATMNRLQGPAVGIAVGIAVSLALGCGGAEQQFHSFDAMARGSQERQPGPQPPRVVSHLGLPAPCDDSAFIDTAAAFHRVHRAALDRVGPRGSEAYNDFIDRSEVIPLHRMLVSAPDLPRNEMHDCQRLILTDAEGNRRLGPLVGIFTDERIEGPAPEGSVVADIINFSDVDYADLGLARGLNCLWMQRVGREWVARIARPRIEQRTGKPSCIDISAPDESVPELQTSSQTFFVLAFWKRYPTTARWMWDEKTSRQYIGIRCGDAWCSVARPGTSVPMRRFFRTASVPGWFDEQYLSYVEEGAGIRLSNLFGTVRPGPAAQFDRYEEQLERLRQGAMVVASVSLSGDHPDARRAYAEKFGHYGSARNRYNILMRVTSQGEWQTAVQGPDQVFRTVTRSSRVPHSGLHTVRWRWHENDEGLWAPCDAGCCEPKTRDDT